MENITSQDPEPVAVAVMPDKKPSRWRRLFWQGKIGPAFWTVSSLVSITVNIVLIVVLVVLVRQIFALQSLVTNQLIGALHDNFALMDEARIQTTVKVNTTIPVQFDLPVSTSTMVKLTEDTRIRNATVNLSTGGLVIRNAPANIILPAGTELPIKLNIVVPVDTTIPVELTVPVDIPMNETELHEPFMGLHNIVSPYQDLLGGLPVTWQEIPLCTSRLGWICGWVFGE